MTKKEQYEAFCQGTYVPIYSKPWWLDAICGAENWDVWLYESGGTVMAAMPYYMERRGSYRYITKAPLTQNNGIIFKEDPKRKFAKEASLQEKIISAACEYIESLKLDVYEQQYVHTFTNWSPFFWHNYTSLLRYTYIIEDTSSMEKIWADFTPEYRNEIRKGQKLVEVAEDLPADVFYAEHEKIFAKQGLKCPFSEELWNRLYAACQEHGAGKTYYAKDAEGNIHAVLYLIWDERYMYHLLGGSMPEYSYSQAYSVLTYHGIEQAHKRGCAYDFEGSMIQRIARSFRQYGGKPMPYYRIRKVFNPEIVRKEAEDYIRRVQSENANQQ